MTGLFQKIFGGKKKDAKIDGPLDLVEDVLKGLIDASGFELTFESNYDQEVDEIQVELIGTDAELLKAKEGQLLDAIQLYLKRVVQHQLPDVKTHVSIDSEGFREEANQALIDLADKLREIALSKGKSVYFRALPPKDRKVIHQYLAEDGRVKSRSIGDGHYKKIKIYPAKEQFDDNSAGDEHAVPTN